MRLVSCIGWVALLSLACSGPLAPDGAVCADVAHRLCAQPTCTAVATHFGAVDSCEATLSARAGCDADGFTFTTPSRTRFLECRLPLLRSGSTTSVHPACADVAETLDTCPDLVRFYGGTP